MGFRELTLAGLIAAAPLSGVLAQSLGVHPGQWESATTVTSMVAPNAPAGVIDAMRGKTHQMSHCLTPQEAARGPQDMLKSNKACAYTRYSMVNGKLSAQMQCKMGASTMTVVIDGSFTANSYTSTSHTVATGPMAMTMTTTASGHRVGDCQK
jgi:hypothetical protein